MKKGLKKTFKIFGIFIVLIIAAIILIPILFKGKILEIAQEQANNNLNAVIKFSDLDLSLIKNFPDLSVELKELSVVGVDTFKNDTLVYFDSFQAGLNLMSVINGEEIKVNKVILKNPKMKAIVLQNGMANWDITLPDTVKTLEKEDTISEPTKFKVNLKKFEIINANIIYDDKSSNMYSEIENFNFKLKGDMTQDMTDLDIEMLIEALTFKMDNVSYLKKAKIGFKSEIEADLKNSVYKFKDNVFSLNEIELGFAGTVEMPDTNIITDITFEAKKTEFKSVLSLIPAIYMKDFSTIQTSGNFAFNGYAKGTYNAVNMPAFGIVLAVKNARFQYPDLPKSVENINIDVKVDAQEGSGEYMTVDLKNAHIEMAKNPFDMKMFINMTPADIKMRGNVNGTIVLESLKDVVPMEDMDITGKIIADLNFAGNMSDIEKEQYEKFNANGNLKLENFNLKMADVPPVNISSTSMDFSPQFVKLNNFDCTVGKSDFHLNGNIDNILSYVFKDELLTGTFNFSSDYLDVNEFMTDSGEETAESETETLSENTGESTALEIPSNIDFTLNSDLKKIIYDKLEITNTTGKIIVKNSKLDMNQLKMNLLDGSMIMSGSYDAKEISKPKADFNMNISNFDIKKMYESVTTIQEMATFAESCGGKISMSLDFNTILDNEMMPVYETFNGSGNIKSNSIGVRNNKAFNRLADLTKVEKYRNPTLQNIDVYFKITNGNIIVEPTTLSASGSKFTFGGTQNLDKKIDFDISMEIPSNLAGNVLSNLPVGNMPSEIEITAKIGNTVDDPKITNFRSNVTDGLKEELEEKVEEVKEVAKEKAKKLLENAQREADRIVKVAEQQANNVRTQARKGGDLIISEARNQGNALIKKARDPFSKKAAKIASDKLVKEARKKANQLNNEAKKQSDNIINKAKQKSKQILDKAKRDAEKM